MAHFAQLDENNIVTQVIVIHNNELIDPNTLLESEEIGVAFCKSLYGSDTKWKQTSYNNTIRKNYAGIGFEYNSILDAFISPKPFPSWILNESICQWEAPVPKPTDDKNYIWDENTISWIISTPPKISNTDIKLG
jgi:hypothetical protein